ncbi:MAG: hypothetical protein WC732_03755 [Candidatus Omnitrophota bacterium]
MKRCRKCRAPLEGPLGTIAKTLFRLRPSQEDPGLCNKCAPREKKGTYVCAVCQRAVDEKKALTHIKGEEYLLELIRRDHPEWKEEHGACPKCVEYYRELIQRGNL